MENQEPSINKKRVNGRLLLLCILLAIIVPIVMMTQLIGLTFFLTVFMHSMSGMTIGFIVYYILTFITIAWSIKAGVVLWMIKPNAVKIAKRFLKFSIFYSILDLIYGSFISLMADEDGTEIFSIFFYFLIKIGFIIWIISYLNRSEEVKATYSSNSTSEDSGLPKEDELV